MEEKNIQGPEQQLQFYNRDRCCKCQGILVLRENRKECRQCLGHFELFNHYPVFISWKIKSKT